MDLMNLAGITHFLTILIPEISIIALILARAAINPL